MPHVASAQDRQLVVEGLRARITRGGIRMPDTSDLRDTSIALYPDVHFYLSDVELEHGGEFRMYSAVDDAGQLYLLDAPASFRLLHSRSFRGTVDSVTAVTIALLAARFGGQLPATFHLQSLGGFLLQAVSGGGGRVPYAWRITLAATSGTKAVRLIYEIDARDGMPRLTSRPCEEWCETTILEP